MQRLLSHPLVIALCTAVAIIFFVSLDRNAQTAHTSVGTLQSLAEQTQQLETEVTSLQQQLGDASTDLSKEKIIRNELLLQKTGEYVVQLPTSELEVEITTEAPTTDTPWEAWKKVLL